jgi:hypothetical protein
VANTWETNPQINSDHEWTLWFSDPKMFRDARFENGKWVGPASVLAKLPIELTVNLDEAA